MSILDKIQKNVPDCTYHVNIGIGWLNEAIEQYSIDLDPPYQRGYIWTEEQESKFVGACLENYNTIPPFWFNWKNKEFERDSCEVVDGKQRIKASLRWINNEIIAQCPCGIKVWYKNLDTIDLRNISTGVMFNWNFVDLGRIAVMQFYIRLNCGGTIHTEEELSKVRKLIENELKTERR